MQTIVVEHTLRDVRQVAIASGSGEWLPQSTKLSPTSSITPGAVVSHGSAAMNPCFRKSQSPAASLGSRCRKARRPSAPRGVRARTAANRRPQSRHQGGIAVMGSDTGNDVWPAQYEKVTQPIHQVGITAMGLWILDNANLEEVAQACAIRSRWEFLVSINPYGCRTRPARP
jgi:hypothetical protein